MFARYALLTSLALALPCPWGRAQGTGGQHLQLHLDFCISAFLHETLFPVCDLLSSFASFKSFLSNMYNGPTACTKPSGPDLLATPLIDCIEKVKTTKVFSASRAALRLFSQPEQAELRGAVARVGFAAALVSRRLQHHSPDRGKPRWVPFMECDLIFQEAQCTWRSG